MEKWKEEDSDGCTWWPDGDWNSCCLIHDEAYHYGGTWRDRLFANGRLAKCVARSGGKKGGTVRRTASRVGHWVMAPVMFIGTQAIGSVLWPYHMKWNNKNDL